MTHFQLPNPLSRGEITLRLGSIVDGADIQNAVPLDPVEELSLYFLVSPAKGRLHLVIQVPPLHECQPSALSYAKDIHSVFS